MQAEDSHVTQNADGTYTFGAAFGDDTVQNTEASHSAYQPIRRAALYVLARTYDELAEPITQDDTPKAEALVYLAEQVGEFLEWRKREQELLEAANARLLLLLSQEVERLEAAETRH